MKTKTSLLALSLIVILAGCASYGDKGMNGTAGDHKMMRDHGDMMNKNMGKPMMDMNNGGSMDTREDMNIRVESDSSSEE